MNIETKSCQSCKQQFTIEPADFEFYKKIQVPAPTICPPCRFKRKALWRNERTLYNRTCDLCKKHMLSRYGPETPYTVYCENCYISDKLNPEQFGMVYDPGRPFFEQFAELLRRVPKRNVYTSSVGSNINSEYQNFAGQNKDCYMVFNGGYSEGVMYSRGMRDCRDSVDLYYCTRIERCYECLNVHDSSGVFYGQNVRNGMDLMFSRDCIGCTDCFGCVNLRYKQHCFFNEQLTATEYKKRVDEIRGSFRKMSEARQRFDELSRNSPHKENSNLKSEDCTGDYLVDSKSCVHCFETTQSENCKYCYFTKTTKDSYDCIGFGYESELLLETVAVGHSQRVIGTCGADYSHDIEYSFDLLSCEYCFGCDGLKHKRFMILNTEYSEDDYTKLRAQIVEALIREGTYGLFFSPTLAPFCYNETVAQDYIPLTKDEAVRQGYRWEDNLPGTFGKETLHVDQIADHISDVPDTIAGEILACVKCHRNYKVIMQELAFYRKMRLPIPRLCFPCRYRERLSRRGPIKLFERTCDKCGKPIKTTFAPDRPEKVWCEGCYTAEMV